VDQDHSSETHLSINFMDQGKNRKGLLFCYEKEEGYGHTKPFLKIQGSLELSFG
jgi:hypothetical protein